VTADRLSGTLGYARFRVALATHGPLRAFGDCPELGLTASLSPEFAQGVGLFVQKAAVGHMRILFVHLNAAPPASGSENFPGIDQILTWLRNEEQPGDALAMIGEEARKRQRTFAATLLELHAEDPHGNHAVDERELKRVMGSRFKTSAAAEATQLIFVNACTGGLPPLVHLGAQGLLFPVRSWIPAGITERWRPLCQNLECAIGDRLVVHGEIPGAGAAIQGFHDALQRTADWTNVTALAPFLELEFSPLEGSPT
jgi:hypothetical protein